MPSRRSFLKQATMTAMAGSFAVGAPQFAFARTGSGKTFIKVFMGGGADGLHLLPPIGDPNYYLVRPNIAVRQPDAADPSAAIKLPGHDGVRALNPNLSPLMEIWDDKNLSFFPATGLVNGDRSHFRKTMMTNYAAPKGDSGGWIGRYFEYASSSTHPLRGAGLKAGSYALKGKKRLPVITNPRGLDISFPDLCAGDGCSDNLLTNEVLSMIDGANTHLSAIAESQKLLIDSSDIIMSSWDAHSTSAGGLEYSESRLGQGLKMAASLLANGHPLEMATIPWDNRWDTHKHIIAEGDNPIGDQNKYYNKNLRNGALDLLCFYRDLKSKGLLDNVVLLVATEFGREIRENGIFGAEHGHAGCWFAFGGPVKGEVALDSALPEVDPANPRRLRGDDRFLSYAMDYRDILSEIVVRHMGASESVVSKVFPKWDWTDRKILTA